MLKPLLRILIYLSAQNRHCRLGVCHISMHYIPFLKEMLHHLLEHFGKKRELKNHSNNKDIEKNV